MPKKKKAAPAESQQNSDGTPLSVHDWIALSSVGDVKRLLRWVIVAVVADHVDQKKGAVLGQLSNDLLHTLHQEHEETTAKRLDQLEQLLAALQVQPSPSVPPNGTQQHHQ